jgi:hypothetical protein
MTEKQFQAKTFNNFLNQEEVNKFVTFCETTDLWRSIPDNAWDKRLVNYNSLPEELKNILTNTILKIKQTFEKEYNLNKPIYPDGMDVVRWFPGMSQDPHCDDMSETNSKETQKVFGHRYFGCIIYLNTNYEGGKTYYPEHNFEITPEAGKLAVHLGDCNHRHGVTPVLNGNRYTIASFWTFDKSRAIQGIDYKDI